MLAIQRRSFIRVAAAAPVWLGAAVNPKPNVVLIVADDLGSGDLSSYGCPDIQTPNIDSIGAAGVRFTRFYANGPECSPTRSALLSGRYQQRFGGLECAIGVGDVGRYDEAAWLQKQGELGLPAEAVTLPRVFKRAGYDTGLFGKWHLGYPRKFWPERHGFDESFGILGGNADYFTHIEKDGGPALFANGKLIKRSGYLTDLIADEAVAWLKRRGSGKPFFLYLPFNAPHQPIQGPDGAEPGQSGSRPVYKAMVERMDKRVGDVLAQLERSAAAANTIVIFISDNGADNNGRNAPLRGRKSTLWEGGIRVPCLMRWPGGVPAGRVFSQPGLTMDLMPTLLSAAQIKFPDGLTFDGVDLLPAVSKGATLARRPLFWRFKRGDRVWKCAREGDMKLVVDPAGKAELHDLSVDELEQNDLYSQRGATVESLKASLAAWERNVIAPRLSAFPGAKR